MSIRHPVPVLCACGCGGWTKGQSKSGFIKGHANRGSRYAPRSPGFPAGVQVDPDDEAALGHHSWSLSGNGYVQRHHVKNDGRYTKIRLHREIMGFPTRWIEVDHINGDKLDNRRCNLRLATRQMNGQNAVRNTGSSGHRGVSWRAKRCQWYAYAKINGHMLSLGFYDDLEEAARVAREYREKHYVGYIQR